MFLEETPEQQALRSELRAYYADLLTPEVRAGLAGGGEGGEMWRQVVARVGSDGWLGGRRKSVVRVVRRRISSSSSTRPAAQERLSRSSPSTPLARQ